MSFDDDFPSLTKDEDYFLHCIEDAENLIQKHCLNKQKVRKALHKMFDLWNTTGYRLDHDDWVEFEKELGLTTIK